jgi:hypothetical protein
MVGSLKLTDSQMDETILKIIVDSPGIVTKAGIINQMGGTRKIKDRLRMRFNENSELQRALDQKNLDILQKASGPEFDRLVTENNWNSLSPAVVSYIKLIITDRIVDAINSFEGGVPSRSNLHMSRKPLYLSFELVAQFAKNNSQIQDAFDNKGIEHIQSLDDQKFDALVNSKQWNTLSQKVKDAVHQRMVERISQAIESLSGKVNGHSLSCEGGGPLPYGQSTINRLIRSSQSLRDQIELHDMKRKSTIRKPAAAVAPLVARRLRV